MPPNGQRSRQQEHAGTDHAADDERWRSESDFRRGSVIWLRGSLPRAFRTASGSCRLCTRHHRLGRTPEAVRRRLEIVDDTMMLLVLDTEIEARTFKSQNAL
jgi:hypothetical protein